MKCPYCNELEDKVIDSRTIKDGTAIRRRRQCLSCGARFTSYETIEDIQIRVVKKDGRREIFDRNKIRIGIEKACEKRPISTDSISEIVDRIEAKLTRGKNEMPSREIGETVIKELAALDEVAYVRFASVYREFKDVNEFMDELKGLLIDNSANINNKKQRNKKNS
ncbi:MAG TPA: transcriptional regulator NrdR [bacterium]|nr:transcriptional regulator NrdR [bacterium]